MNKNWINTNEKTNRFSDLRKLRNYNGNKDGIFEIYESYVEDLKMNLYNGRFATEVFKNNIILNEAPDIVEKNKIIQKIIRENSNSYEDLKNEINEYGQRELGVVNLDGVIIDGNRRATVCNELGIKFKFIILEGDFFSKQEIESAEAFIQLKRVDKESYSKINTRLKILSIYESIINGKADYWNISEEAIEKVGEYIKLPSKRAGKEIIASMALLREAMEFWNEDNSFYIYENMDQKFKHFYNSLISIKSAASNQEIWFDEKMINEFKTFMFNLIRYEYSLQFGRKLLYVNNKDLRVLKDEKIWNNFKSEIENKILIFNYKENEKYDEVFISISHAINNAINLEIKQENDNELSKNFTFILIKENIDQLVKQGVLKNDIKNELLKILK